MTTLPHSKTGQVTSALAGSDLHASGVAASQRRAVLDALRRHPGATPGELALVLALDRVQVARRLNDCAHLGEALTGPVRRCRASGRTVMTWLPREDQGELGL